ncbi:MurR/RpiR family transcriptional regulator [Thomasclavelia sp.]|uniref:MurR/RpiR family transcriptional regulator n=1 Tax=Thomasclavelia sp. TaxID=3025757 RepID=UPI0025F79303|nr:MurR/RpiR family transcriptional regulator [Thomasclavelia sp.]
MSLLSKLEYKKGFSDLEKGIANYLIDHKEEVADMKLVDLADATYTSTATISRFCKKLGEKDYNSFRMNFMKSVLFEYQSDVDFNRPFKDKDSLEEISLGISNLYKDTVEATRNLLDFEQFNQIVEELYNAKTIDVYAKDTSYLSASMFEHRMITINQSINLNSLYDQERRLLYMNKDSIAIIVSYSGESESIYEVIKHLKEKKIKIIAVTSINDSYLRKNATYCLTMCSKENVISKIDSFSSKVSSDYIMDLIFSALFQKNYYLNLIHKIEREQK